MEQKPKIALLGMNPDRLAEVAAEAGLRRFAAGQMAKWIYDKRVSAIDEMTDLPKQARALIAEKYCVGTYAPRLVTESADGTRKYLFEGAGGRDVEAVYIPDGDRATLCVSSQAGCKMGCTFCMTGRQGFHGNLAASQILNQIFSIPESRSLTNIVFMGMGEPMDNLDEVLCAIDALTAKWGLGWSPTRITVSTIGKLAEMKRLIETTKVHLAVSVHSPLPSQRAELMPVERAFPMVKIVDLLRKYDFAHQRRLTMEYIMWRGVNDTIRHAEALARLIKGTGARVNLIRFHAIPGSPLAPATTQAMEAFRDRLNAIGVTATIRASRGEDIMAACGMLAGKQKDN